MYIGTQAEVPSSGLRGAGTASTILTRDWLYAWIQYGKSRDPCVLLPTKQPGSSRRIFTTIPKRVTSGADLVIHPQTHADLQNVPDILLHSPMPALHTSPESRASSVSLFRYPIPTILAHERGCETGRQRPPHRVHIQLYPYPALTLHPIEHHPNLPDLSVPVPSIPSPSIMLML